MKEKLAQAGGGGDAEVVLVYVINMYLWARVEALYEAGSRKVLVEGFQV
jgi:hypothetical protein